MIAEMTGRRDEAIACYRRAIDSNPRMADAHASLGTALARQHQFPEAIAELEAALKIDPNNRMAQQNLERAMRNFERATQQLQNGNR